MDPLNVSFITKQEEIAATGQSYQLLASIDVENPNADPVRLAGNEHELGIALGVSITDIDPDFTPEIQYLYQGKDDSQLDLTTSPQEIAGSEAVTVQVRLIKPPGNPGSFVLHAGPEETTITVA
jgi:hypothetical protein